MKSRNELNEDFQNLMSRHWQNILESMSIALMLVDTKGEILLVNTSAEDLLSTSRRSIEGRVLKDIFVEKKGLQTLFNRCVKTAAKYTYREMEFVNLMSKFAADITLTPITLDGYETKQGDKVDSAILLELVRTDRISRVAQETQNIEQQKSNRLMMRGMSHEIKNPLSGIRGAAQLLQSELADPEQQEFTKIIIRESDRLTNLVSRVMGSHRQYAFEPVNIHYVVEHVAKLVKASKPQGLTIKKDYDPSLPEFMGDAEQLIQAIMNIVKNAVEAQENSAEQVVGIRTRLERNFTVGKVLHRNLIKLQIWDHGQGVPEEIKQLIFNPMITGRAEGTGIGLAISQEIIQRHDGLIALEEFNQHTCFSIYLPLVRKET
jgi:two-component system nitrogen regulation sensor histidine kinase GlnL